MLPVTEAFMNAFKESEFECCLLYTSAAEFQVARIAKAAGRTESEVREIIQT